ncbi:formylglycine-generating enzyme family protein [bacterium]|nr:formylglycine-generating enzyme family protein [bacterium]
MGRGDRFNPSIFFGIIIATVFLTSCGGGGDDNPTSVTTGTVTVDVSPDGIGANWTLRQEGAIIAQGPEDKTVTGAEAGIYVITWERKDGWAAPDPLTVTKTLTRQGQITFSGVFEVANAVIVIDTEPDDIDAPWHLDMPAGLETSGTGDTELTLMAAGEYTLTWGSVEGYWSPEPDEVDATLDQEETHTFTGTYVKHPGTIVIEPVPTGLAAPWSLYTPGGVIIEGSGAQTLVAPAVGDYLITWLPVGGYAAPPKESLNLVQDGTLTFTGYYISTSLEGFVLVPDGTFMMGSPVGEAGRQPDEIQHQVTLTRSFFLQEREVTNAEFVAELQWALDQGLIAATSSTAHLDDPGDPGVELVDLDDPYSRISYGGGSFTTDRPDWPVVVATWFGAAAYCNWVSEKSGLPPAYAYQANGNWLCNGGDVYGARGYRLPTEAEWEYACRAGSATAFANGPITPFEVTECHADPVLAVIGWYCDNAGVAPHDVGTLQANAWGFHDMHGNAREWCHDWYGNYPSVPVQDPDGPYYNQVRVIRGGYFGSFHMDCRSARRFELTRPDQGDYEAGFRLALSAY